METVKENTKIFLAILMIFNYILMFVCFAFGVIAFYEKNIGLGIFYIFVCVINMFACGYIQSTLGE